MEPLKKLAWKFIADKFIVEGKDYHPTRTELADFGEALGYTRSVENLFNTFDCVYHEERDSIKSAICSLK